jgi:hypothetical protein
MRRRLLCVIIPHSLSYIIESRYITANPFITQRQRLITTRKPRSIITVTVATDITIVGTTEVEGMAMDVGAMKVVDIMATVTGASEFTAV